MKSFLQETAHAAPARQLAFDLLQQADRAQADAPRPIVTTIEPMARWWPAEGYHQDYWETSGRSNPYCMAVIPPKLQKLRKSFAAKTKSLATA